MKKNYFLVLVILWIGVISCSKDDDNGVVPVVEVEPDPVDPDQLNISEENISHTTIDLVWDAITTENEVNVDYDIVLNGQLIKEGNIDTDYTLTSLTHNTEYKGQIIARENSKPKRGKTNQKSNGKSDDDEIKIIPFSVTTKMFANENAAEPSSFSINTDDVKQTLVNLTWNAVTIEDDSDISYTIYLEGNLIKSSLAETRYTIAQLEANTQYEGVVLAVSSNEKTKAIGFSFKTLEVDEDAAVPEDFEVTVNDIVSNSVILKWEKPIIEDDSEITYDIIVNGQIIEEDFKGSATTEFLLKDLEATTDYKGEIVAKSSNGNFKSSVFSFKTKKAETDGAAPDVFEVTPKFVFGTRASMEWKKASISDDSEISYFVFLENEQLNVVISETESNFTTQLKNLENDTQYKGQVVAKSSNGNSTAIDFSFRTKKHDLGILKFSTASIQLIETETRTIKAFFTGLDTGASKEIKYTIDNTNAATIETVDNEIMVTAVAEGVAVITATSVEDSSLTTQITINVIPDAVPITDLMINADLIYSGRLTQAFVNVVPRNATNKNVIWSSSDTNIAEVDNFGNIFGLNSGNVTITATSTTNQQVMASVETFVQNNPLIFDFRSGVLYGEASDFITVSLDGSYFAQPNEVITIDLQVHTGSNRTGTLLLENLAEIRVPQNHDPDTRISINIVLDQKDFTMPNNGEVHFSAALSDNTNKSQFNFQMTSSFTGLSEFTTIGSTSRFIQESAFQ